MYQYPGITQKEICDKLSIAPSTSTRFTIWMVPPLFNEPTNHLDQDAKAELKRALKSYKGSMLLISHEPEFYQDVVTDIWDVESWTTKAI